MSEIDDVIEVLQCTLDTEVMSESVRGAIIGAVNVLAAARAASGLTEEQRDALSGDVGRRDLRLAIDAALSAIDSLTAENARLKEQIAAKERDSERLDYLDALVKHPPFRCDVILQHDHEDGVWLASIERGRAYGVTPIDSDISTPHLDVRAAIDSAAKERPLNIAPAAEGGDGARHP